MPSVAPGSTSHRGPLARPPRILLLPLDFATWQRGRPLSYCMSFGVEEGLRGLGCECRVVPLLADFCTDEPGSWLASPERLLGHERFDQVWIWLPHNRFAPRTLDWIRELAPIRVGLLLESAYYTALEYQVHPWLVGRDALIEEQARALTHLAVVDEQDKVHAARWGKESLDWAPAVPARVLERTPRAAKDDRAAFSGSVYGARGALLEHPLLIGELVKSAPAEEGTSIPQAFDALNASVLARLLAGERTLELLEQHTDGLRFIRRLAFERWLTSIESYRVAVSLPTLVKAYSPRVVEAMAVRRPVVAWEVPERPLNRALFRHGEELLLFDDASGLAEGLARLRREPELAETLVQSAWTRISEAHTIEVRTAQLLEWLERTASGSTTSRALPQ
jgi:hypothetical protein